MGRIINRNSPNKNKSIWQNVLNHFTIEVMSAQKSSAGIIVIPLILLIVGVVFVGAGGVYIVRDRFVKKGVSGKPALDEYAIQRQIKEKMNLSPVTPTPTPRLAPDQFSYYSKEVIKITTQGTKEKVKEPGFTISPPEGWLQGSQAEVTVIFNSPEKDEEPGEPPLIYRQPANIQVSLDYLENYDQVITPGMSESQILDKVVAEFKKISSSLNPDYIQDKRTTFAGQEAQFLEVKVQLKHGIFERAIAYVLVKNKYAIQVSGHALNSAWGERVGTLQSSLNSFKLTDRWVLTARGFLFYRQFFSSPLLFWL